VYFIFNIMESELIVLVCIYNFALNFIQYYMQMWNNTADDTTFW